MALCRPPREAAGGHCSRLKDLIDVDLRVSQHAADPLVTHVQPFGLPRQRRRNVHQVGPQHPPRQRRRQHRQGTLRQRPQPASRLGLQRGMIRTEQPWRQADHGRKHETGDEMVIREIDTKWPITEG